MAVLQTSLAEVASSFPANEPPPQMQVRKRNGSSEPVDVNKIVRAVQRCCYGLPHVDRDAHREQDHRRFVSTARRRASWMRSRYRPRRR